MHRVLWVSFLVLFLAVASTGAGLRTAPGAHAQDSAAAAAETAVLLADLEIAADFAGLYDLLHPDAWAVVPFDAMAGWYAADFLLRGPYPIEVLDVRFVEWTWDVTGVVYPWTAEVAYRQTFWDGGAETAVDAVVHLVEADGSWRWFFGADMPFLAEQTARYAAAGGNTTLAAAPDLPAVLATDLDGFWSGLFAGAGFSYVSPSAVAFAEEVATPCGPASAALGPAAYCAIDATIYWESDWMERLRDERGDFAWAAVVAHEWGHHVQVQLGLSRSLAPESLGELYPIDLELQADCLSGAYAQDAEWRGLLSSGDVSAAMTLAFDSGDTAGIPWYDAGAHGTSGMRVDSFLIGYTGGASACGLPI